jgi:hypothetical protein
MKRYGKIWRAATYRMSAEELRHMQPFDLTYHRVALRVIRLREHAPQYRWEQAHGIPSPLAWMEAICQWCGETVAHEIEFNPRHDDSRQQAVAICHGLVEYHLINGDCKRGIGG